MIPIINQTTDSNSFVFEINLPLLFFVKQMSFAENKKLSADIFYIPPKADTNRLLIATSEVSKIVEDFTKPTIEEIAKTHNFEIIKIYHGKQGKDYNNKNMLSFAYYFNLYTNLSIPNLSSEMNKSLSTISIRLGNHINEKEYDNYKSRETVRTYHQQVLDLYESDLIRYTNNVFDAYDKFLYNLCNYSYDINSYADILSTDIDIVKAYAIQGTFTLDNIKNQ